MMSAPADKTRRRIEALIAEIDEAIEPEVPSPEVLEIMEWYETLPRRAQWRFLLLMNLEDAVRFGRENVIRDARCQPP